MKLNRTLTDIRNELIRVKGNIEALQSHPFNEEDRAILEPRYRDHLQRLEEEEKIFRMQVTDPETLKA